MKNEEIIKKIEKLLELRNERTEELWNIIKADDKIENEHLEDDVKIIGFISGILMDKFIENKDTFNLKCLSSIYSAFAQVAKSAIVSFELTEKFENNNVDYKEKE